MSEESERFKKLEAIAEQRDSFRPIHPFYDDSEGPWLPKTTESLGEELPPHLRPPYPGSGPVESRLVHGGDKPDEVYVWNGKQFVPKSLYVPGETHAADEEFSLDVVATPDEIKKRVESARQYLSEVGRPKEMVNSPSHYQGTFHGHKIEVADVLEIFDQCGNHYVATAVTYLLRAGKKDPFLQDVKKASWYLLREIARLEGKLNDDSECETSSSASKASGVQD